MSGLSCSVDRDSVHPSVRVDVHLDGDSWGPALRDDVARGLTAPRKELPPKWFYDDAGSELFDKITRLPEYYPTEAERAILTERAAEIITMSGADTLVELGSGVSDKSRVLLDALAETGRSVRYVPFDVSEDTLRAAADAIAATYPTMTVHGVVGDFDHHLSAIPRGGRRLFAFLGSTIGNFTPQPRQRFLADVVSVMEPGDTFLLGADLVKAIDRLEAAYDDQAGVTAAFNQNVLRVINRELGADFDLDRFEHVARFDTEHQWIEMLLRSEADQRVTIADLDLVVDFAEGETILTEISAKFRRPGLEAELADAGLECLAWWTDPRGDFALSLSVVPLSQH